MASKIYFENDKTIKFILTEHNQVIIEIYDYSTGIEQVSVCLRYSNFEFMDVLRLYAMNELSL